MRLDHVKWPDDWTTEQTEEALELVRSILPDAVLGLTRYTPLENYKTSDLKSYKHALERMGLPKEDVLEACANFAHQKQKLKIRAN